MSNKIGVNEKCPCGSGIKYKKCCMNKKPREQIIHISNKNLKVIKGFSINSKGGVALIEKDGSLLEPDKTAHCNYFRKENGKNKILNAVIDVPNLCNINDKLYTFDWLIAIDTNTKIINSEKISVTAILQTSRSKNFKEDSVEIIFAKNIKENYEEKIAIRQAINEIIHDNNYKKETKIGIVTDHDAGNIEKYNEGKIPFIDDFYIPENFELIYATSDAGTNDFLLNALIGQCDKVAKQKLKEIEAGNLKI